MPQRLVTRQSRSSRSQLCRSVFSLPRIVDRAGDRRIVLFKLWLRDCTSSLNPFQCQNCATTLISVPAAAISATLTRSKSPSRCGWLSSTDCFPRSCCPPVALILMHPSVPGRLLCIHDVNYPHRGTRQLHQDTDSTPCLAHNLRQKCQYRVGKVVWSPRCTHHCPRGHEFSVNLGRTHRRRA